MFLPQLVEDPGISSVAVRITEGGLIAGTCDSVPTVGLQGNPQPRAVLWDGAGITNLGTLGGDLSQALGVNEDGMVVGVSNLLPGDLIRAFAWTDTMGMVQLPGFDPANRTVAYDVNASGLIVGDADHSLLSRSAVKWTDPATLKILPRLEGDGNTEAYGVNDFGQIVGRAAVGPSLDARLWQGRDVYDLNAMHDMPQIDLSQCSRINERGQILCLAFDTTQNPLEAVAVILTPDGRWTDLGAALAGTHGEPTLSGLGNLLPAGPVHLDVGGGLEGAGAFLFLGFSALNFSPFYGGTLVPDPNPPSLLLPLPLDGDGRLSLTGLWPENVPSDLALYFQVWIADPGAPFGFAATNALRAVTP